MLVDLPFVSQKYNKEGYFLGLREFEVFMIPVGCKIVFDPDKNDKNRKKHKYGLDCAADILQDATIPGQGGILVVRERYFENGEKRTAIISRYNRITTSGNDPVVLIVVTERENVLRIISMRQANPKEVEIYKQCMKDLLSS